MGKLIWVLCGLLLVSWLLGVVTKVADGTIHLLLVIAGVLGIVNVVRGGQSGPAPE